MSISSCSLEKLQKQVNFFETIAFKLIDLLTDEAQLTRLPKTGIVLKMLLEMIGRNIDKEYKKWYQKRLYSI